MKVTHFSPLALLLPIQANAHLGSDRTETSQSLDPCTPIAQGYEMIDDSPAINEALKACGNGGTIVLPEDQTYSIRTPIDFTPCKKCDFQIEGALIVASDEWEYWKGIDSTFTLANVTGARIRSVTGKGVLDGNAVTYYLGRYDSGFWFTRPFVHITNDSSDISIENLTMKNAMLVLAHPMETNRCTNDDSGIASSAPTEIPPISRYLT